MIRVWVNVGRQKKVLVYIYVHNDGYPSELGKRLAKLLMDFRGLDIYRMAVEIVKELASALFESEGDGDYIYDVYQRGTAYRIRTFIPSDLEKSVDVKASDYNGEEIEGYLD